MYLKQGSVLQNGRYRIEKLLGEGGFGLTYLAAQTGLNRWVAVKEFFIAQHCNRDGNTAHVNVPSTGSREMVTRFREKFMQEAQTIASMHNPHIVRIFDIFEENGTAYYVMEYLDGGSLSGRVPEGGMDHVEAAGYIRQLCKALEYIHSQNILHLDVKPSNVLFRSNGEAVLIDFGISKHYNEANDSKTTATPAGMSCGYAPLEQSVAGGLSQFTPATDIYSLGATFYAILSGKTPPSADEINENGLPPFSRFVPYSIYALIEKAMQPRRKDRPQTIREFLMLMDNAMKAPVPPPPAMSGPSVVSTPVSGPSYPPLPVQKKKNPYLWLAWALPLFFLFVGAVVFLLPVQKRKKVEDTAVVQTTGVHNGYSWVDLGLPSGLMWATCNIGASKADDPGYYFSWGESEPKPRGLGYVSSSADFYQNDISGNYSYDAARLKWGGNWRIPTKAEFEELLEECSWTWTKQAGRNGYKVTSRNNGSSIFLPAAGLRDGVEMVGADKSGNYWSSTPNNAKSERAYSLELMDYGPSVSANYRKYGGLTIRPVLDDPTWVATPAVEEPEAWPVEEEPAAWPVEEEVLPVMPEEVVPVLPVEDVTVEELTEEDFEDDWEESLLDYYTEEVVEEVVEEEAIPFQLVETKPTFMGGAANQFSKWVNQRLVYPETAKENGVQGRVTLQFTVEKDGSLTNVKVLRSVDPSLDMEAVRVVSMSPKWTPGKQGDRYVRVSYTFPVIFQLR